jgi:hypothetical protein
MIDIFQAALRPAHSLYICIYIRLWSGLIKDMLFILNQNDIYIHRIKTIYNQTIPWCDPTFVFWSIAKWFEYSFLQKAKWSLTKIYQSNSKFVAFSNDNQIWIVTYIQTITFERYIYIPNKITSFALWNDTILCDVWLYIYTWMFFFVFEFICINEIANSAIGKKPTWMNINIRVYIYNHI